MELAKGLDNAIDIAVGKVLTWRLCCVHRSGSGSPLLFAQ
jgi:hypothetical protein